MNNLTLSLSKALAGTGVTATAGVYLASPLSDFMTGTTFRIDGGSTPTV